MFHYYIIEHDDYELPFMVFADSIGEAVEKVMKHLLDDGNYEEEGIRSVQRIDFDGVVLL